MRVLSKQDLFDLVDGAAIFSAGGGGDPEIGYKIVEKLFSGEYYTQLVAALEIPDQAKVVNFACVGATTAIAYDSQAAVKTLKTLETYTNFSAYATIPVELGGFNTLVAVDVAARSGIPVIDGDGAGRSVPEVHLKVYTIDKIPLTPMVIADTYAENVVIIKKTYDSKAAERVARILAAEWNQSAYTARRILTGVQAKSSPIQFSLSNAMKIGKLLRTTKKPIKEVLKETNGFKLFEGIVDNVERETTAGFTFIETELKGTKEFDKKQFEFKAKNEVLVAYMNGKLSAIAPDIITPINPENSKCITAEKIERGDRILIIGMPAPKKWRTAKGLELWKDVLERSGIYEVYMPIETLASR